MEDGAKTWLEHAFFRMMRVSGWTFLLALGFQLLGTGGVGDRAYDALLISFVLWVVTYVLARMGW